MDDCISRQAAIDTEGLDAQIRCEMCRNPMHTDRGCDGNCKYDEKLYERIMQILNERIKPLPSTQPEPHWILCAERLPETGQVVLWCNEYGSVFTSAITYRTDKYYSVGRHRGSIVAWMPLPEPYVERRIDG